MGAPSGKDWLIDMNVMNTKLMWNKSVIVTMYDITYDLELGFSRLKSEHNYKWGPISYIIYVYHYDLSSFICNLCHW